MKNIPTLLLARNAVCASRFIRWPRGNPCGMFHHVDDANRADQERDARATHLVIATSLTESTVKVSLCEILHYLHLGFLDKLPDS